MLATSIIAMLSSVGVAFYLRFLIALLKDSMSRLPQSHARPFSLINKTQPARWKFDQSSAGLPTLELKSNTTMNRARRIVI